MNRVSIMLIAAAVFFSMMVMAAEPPKTTDPKPKDEKTTDTKTAVPKPVVPKAADLDLKIGNVRIPRDFVHSGKNYKKGIYYVTLKSKKDEPYFFVHNRKKELLFEELAIVKPYKGKAKKFRFRVRKAMMKGYEYYRLKVVHPEKELLAFFFIKQKEQKKKEKSKPGTQKKPAKKEKTDGSEKL